MRGSQPCCRACCRSVLSLGCLLPARHLLQKELASIQQEKERIATTTIDDELAADPKLAEVGGE